jgi:hypothetical protein
VLQKWWTIGRFRGAGADLEPLGVSFVNILKKVWFHTIGE